MTVEIFCSRCNEKIGTMKILKSIKDASGVVNGKCPSCGHSVSTSEFSLDIVDD